MKQVRILVVAAMLVACDDFRAADPGVDVKIAHEGNDYVFSFRTCWDQRIGIPTIDIVEGRAAGNDGPSHCEISIRDPSIKALSGKWTYGDVPPGYEKMVCKPLEREKLYEVQVDGAAGGRRVFFIRSDGSIELREGTCSKKPPKPFWKRILG